ncbi:MAG TPA: hypothetical protein VEX43_05940 [Chthoniobacterales bacterium]|nr:hypothetical protein [Chthoniobacterales bacterium]
MIATIPPLWRDVDAYSQLTLRPLVTTFWGHAPAYSYLAKVPLFLGEQLERWRGIAGARAESGLPQLTDTGVWLLIGAQHLALGAAAFYFILSISRVFWIRLALAVTWASNALFYTFAHCTGSETLSVVVVILLVTKGLRLVRSRSEPRWVDWYLFAIVLCLCLLSRHANVWLILLLPAAFILSWAHYRVAGLFASSAPRRRRRRLRAKHLRQAVIALAIGIACFGVANSWMQYVARKTKLHPHSRIGHTLMWRLQFLKTLPPPERAALLQKVEARTYSPETRRLLTLLGQMHEEGGEVVGRPFMQRAAVILFPSETSIPWERLDLAVNKMAYAFLLPPTREHWQVARSEFLAALKMSGTEIPDWLLSTTAYFFDHKDEMPACAKLVTFRDHTAESIIQIPERYPYFHLRRGLSYNKAFLIWLGSLLLLIVIARRKKKNVGAIPALGIALIAIGLLMTLSACLVTEFLPRYALPMWQLLLLSLYIFVGAAADLMVNRKEKSAGQLPKLG